MENKRECTCSFCGAKESECEQLFMGENGVFICNECIEACATSLGMGMVDGKVTEHNDATTRDAVGRAKAEGLLRPAEVKAILDESVIGQEEAKKTLAVAVYNHYKRIGVKGSRTIHKSNVLLLGPTGSGKTLLAKSLAEIMEVPFAIADATTLTQTGYVGEDVESILAKLLQAAGGDVEKAQKGIVYLDEIDKLASKKNASTGEKDATGEGVQQALLKLIEGTTVKVPVGGHAKTPMAKMVEMDTSNILFICGGAFVGLKKGKEPSKKTLGFTASCDSEPLVASKEIDPMQLKHFGLIPEFIGRLPIVTELEPLTQDTLVRIMTEPKNAIISQYKELFEMDGVALIFEEDALTEIASQCLKKETGARGLRMVLEKTMRDAMFEVPSMEHVQSCIVTRDAVLGNSPVEVQLQKQAMLKSA